MIPVRIDNLLNPALDVRGQAGQYGRGGPALRKWFSVDRAAVCTGREENLRVISCCPSATMCSAAIRLSAKHLNTLLSLRTAAMIRGGLKDTCDTQETVAAP